LRSFGHPSGGRSKYLGRMELGDIRARSTIESDHLVLVEAAWQSSGRAECVLAARKRVVEGHAQRSGLVAWFWLRALRHPSGEQSMHLGRKELGGTKDTINGRVWSLGSG